MRRLRLRPKPPLGAALFYAAHLRVWLTSFQDHAMTVILKAWSHDHPTRTDAISSTKVSKVLDGLRVDIREGFDPGTHLSQTIRVLAARVVKQNKLEFQRVIGVPTHDLGLGHLIGAFADQNVSLITSLAFDQLLDLQKVLDDADAEAWHVDVLRAKIQDRFDVTKSKADFLARDQTLKLNGQITQARQQNAGISEYYWRTSEDERVRPDHQALDGTRQAWAVPPVVDEASERRAHPGGDFQCRCTADPILPELDSGQADE